MDQPQETRPLRRRVGRATAALAVTAAVALTPGAAQAAPNRSGPPDVVPLVDCVRVNPDGTWTAIFGYDNRTGGEVTIPAGPANQVTPRGYGTPQPTTFAPGVQHGAFSVTVVRGGGPMWHLGATNLPARRGDTSCGPSSQLPADGNGLGGAMVLGAAGVAGALLLGRVRRGKATTGGA
ncbi:hypothetical protein [Blastococcus sp. SYSU D00695]